MYRLRTSQREILAYEGGKMGVSAVPGSGKTWTLSLLAADIIARGEIFDDQEILIVTLVNSAVENFYHRVGRFVRELNLIPNIGYRVRTLHGLAHDIVRERPGLVGLDEDFRILDEKEARLIREDIISSRLRSNPGEFDGYLDLFLSDSRLEWVRDRRLPGLVDEIFLGFIRSAKNFQLSPQKLGERLKAVPNPLPLAEIGVELYAEYQRALQYRGGVDFDDLINYAYTAISSDPEYLDRLRYRWPFILEDEAQDSSYLQEMILVKLTGSEGNWVRVGDPNQAIFETFTTADPKYLREFIDREDVISRNLEESGRSTISIISLANHLAIWTSNSHPFDSVRDALQAAPLIEPTNRDDPQSNPVDDPLNVHLVLDEYSSEGEVEEVVRSVGKWVNDNPDSTVAVLVPRNERGANLVTELKRRKIDFVDSLLNSTNSTRTTAGALSLVLEHLADPKSSRKLAKVFEVYLRKYRDEAVVWKAITNVAEKIRKITHTEHFIYHGLEGDWQNDIDESLDSPEIVEKINYFPELIMRWHEAVILPIDQLVLTVAHDLRFEVAEMALCHKFAGLLRQVMMENAAWRLSEYSQELIEIAKNERRFLGFSDDDLGFDPEKYKGKVIVSTMHKAKGLEWDRVYLMSVNSYNFPSGDPEDVFIAEKWFLNRKINMQAETLAQLDYALDIDELSTYREGVATENARLDYIRERLRLLYVGITRARKELIITWNTGRRQDSGPALPLIELGDFWKVLKLERQE